VDVVARDGEELVIVEVKTRRAGAPGRPMDAVDLKKQRLIRRGANAWLGLLGNRELPWRFDVVEVIVEHGRRARVSWVKNAFGSEPRDVREQVEHPGRWEEV
jgi:putative endonuclease